MTQERDDLCELPTVGPSTEQLLNEQGFLTYEDLSRAHPVKLNQSCDIVLASATSIISGAVDKLQRECPNCSSGSLEPAWSSTEINPTSEESDVQCSDCMWDGKVTEARETPMEIQT